MTDSLHIIGCRAGSPDAERPASGYLLQVNDRLILIDCGPGVVARLAAAGLADRLDAVIITHAHADHCLDIVALAFHRLFPVRMSPIPLYGLASVGVALQSLEQLFGIASLPELRAPLAQALPFHEIAAGAAFRIAETITVQTHLTQHAAPTLALRFPQYGFAFTADAALTPGLGDFVAGVDVLLAEATYLEQADEQALRLHGHMTAAQAGELAATASARHLIITHLADYACSDATKQRAASHFTGTIDIAAPGLTIRLKS